MATITHTPATDAVPAASAVQVLRAENDALRESVAALHAQIETLTSQNSRNRSRELMTAADLAEAYAHMRAALALYATQQAQREGIEQPDPFAHLRGFLEERGLLPDPQAPASALLSEAFASSDDAARAWSGGGQG
jgi:hypothetical protein